MTDKIDYYDIFSTLLLGILLLCWVLLCFPLISTSSFAGYPDALIVLALTALSIFVGQILQAIASLIEPILFWTFGGSPSDMMFNKKLERYIPLDTLVRIKKILKSKLGDDASNRSLFLFAVQRTESAGVGRTSRFNSLYAYHRGLIVLNIVAILIFFVSTRSGVAITWSYSVNLCVTIMLVLLLLLVWHRTKQRAMYYVREVLLTVERVLEETTKSESKSTEKRSS